MAFTIIDSSTILLPAWKTLLQELELKERLMPRDVATRWNSTYDMLVFALEYRAAIDAMSADKTNNLRKFELSEGEWTIMKQLYNVLKVSVTVSHLSPPPLSLLPPRLRTGPEGCNSILLAVYVESCYGDSCHGRH